MRNGPGKSMIHFMRYTLGFDTPQTQTTRAEQAAIRKHATGRKRLVEIGVFEGFTTRILCEAMSQSGELFAVDPFFKGRMGVCWGEAIALREIGKIKPSPQVRFVKKLSFEAVKVIPGEMDFIFIDGDHSLEGIVKDWADWSTKVRSGGVIALHDTSPPAHNPSVSELGSCRYFQSHIRFDNRFRLIEQIDSLNILRREP